MAYDGFDNPVEHVGPTGISPESTYNSRHLLTGQVETSGTGSSRSRSWSYDGRGLPTGEVSFAGRELGYEHDAAGNRTAQTTGEQNTTRWSHDASGRVVSETDPRGDGHSTTFVYDDGDLVTETTDAVGATTGFGYDAVGDLVEQTDPDGATTTYEWDAAGRRVSMLRQGWEQAESWTYYAGFDGQVGVYTDATGAVTRWAYDAADRLMSMRMPRGSVSGEDPAAHRWRYGYDQVGNRTRVRDPDGYLTVTGYDAVNRPVTETDPAGGVTTYRYNRAGQVNRITDPAGNHRLIQRNSLLQVDRITDARGNTTRQSRDADDLVTAEVTPLGFAPATAMTARDAPWRWSRRGVRSSTTRTATRGRTATIRSGIRC